LKSVRQQKVRTRPEKKVLAGDKTVTIQELRHDVKKFIQDRDWEKFHTAKNLSMSIAIEAAELMELFQWKTDRESKKTARAQRQAVEHEIADIAIYVLDFCNTFHIDLSSAIGTKLHHNTLKYPAALVRGKSHKYTHYKKLGARRLLKKNPR